jgi:DNA-directed RNA polymerase specialized sigma24 family protein
MERRVSAPLRGGEEEGAERAMWILTPQAFEGLLLFLDADREAAAEKYELLHRKLIKFFEWRNHPEPERLADETMNRVARKVAEGTEIRATNPASFALGVARMVFLESLRKLEKDHMVARELAASPRENEVPDEDDERRMRCLESCLESMADARDLLIRYYSDNGGKKIETRRQLADELGVASGVLRLRAHRLRARLETCVVGCTKR